MNIYLIRHGRQNSKLCNVDVELSQEGREQAELVGKRLAGYQIEAVYSSNLLRAVETADIINEYVKKPRFYDDRLRGAEFGAMTGLSNDVLKERFGEFLQKRSTMEEDLPYPGGGENSADVYKRAKEALDDIVKEGYENVCIVTHGGLIRALLTGLTGAPSQRWLTFGRQLENCSITELLYDEQMGTFHIERLNDYAHFENEDRLLRKHFGNGFFSAK